MRPQRAFKKIYNATGLQGPAPKLQLGSVRKDAFTQGNTIKMDKRDARALARGNKKATGLALHEIAHTIQPPSFSQLNERLGEAGADIFAKKMMQRKFGKTYRPNNASQNAKHDYRKKFGPGGWKQYM